MEEEIWEAHPRDLFHLAAEGHPHQEKAHPRGNYRNDISDRPLFLGGKRKGDRSTKVVVKSHAFLLDHISIQN